MNVDGFHGLVFFQIASIISLVPTELKKTLVGSSDAPPTPMYTSSLVEGHHVQNTELLAHTAQLAGRSFTESWALVKIWCLQRGFKNNLVAFQ
jgi:hypothetical protein